tara:strand:+ start:51 stop:239 length:189 start_codon:yes stop_codon:yes gene_type:complete
MDVQTMAGYVMLIGVVFLIASIASYFLINNKSEENYNHWLAITLPFIGLFFMYLFIKIAGYL